MDIRSAYLALGDTLRDMSPEAAADELIHRARLFEIHRQSEPIDRALYFALARASKKKRQAKKRHAEMENDRKLAQRAKRSEKWRTLDRYSGELIELHRQGYGARRLADYLWKAHRKKVSYRTVLNWLAERRKGGDL